MTWLSEILASSSQRPIVALVTLDSSGWANPLRLARDRTTTSRGLVFVGASLDVREVEAGLDGLRPGLLRFGSTPDRARLMAGTTSPITFTLELVFGDDADTVVFQAPRARLVAPKIDQAVIEAEIHRPMFVGVRHRLGAFVPSSFPGIRP